MRHVQNCHLRASMCFLSTFLCAPGLRPPCEAARHLQRQDEATDLGQARPSQGQAMQASSWALAEKSLKGARVAPMGNRCSTCHSLLTRSVPSPCSRASRAWKRSKVSLLGLQQSLVTSQSSEMRLPEPHCIAASETASSSPGPWYLTVSSKAQRSSLVAIEDFGVALLQIHHSPP